MDAPNGPGPLFGVPFIVVALYLLIGRFIIDAVGRKRTAYAVTDRRAVIVSGIFNRDTRSIFLRALAEVNITERRSGRGTITFGPSGGLQGMMRGWPGAGKSLPPAFEGIDHARDVLNIIRTAQEAAR